MPAGLTSADRRLLWWAAALLLLLIVGISVMEPPAAENTSVVPSVYSTSPRGAHAAYLLLRDLGFDLHVWEEPPAMLAALAPKALLILAEPVEAPTRADRTALLHFVEGGGRVLFCGAIIPAFFPDAKVKPPLFGATPWILNADLPAAISRGAGHVTMRAQTWWGKIEPSQLRLYGAGDNAGVVSWRIGNGEVLWWASASPLTNAGLPQTANLTLFLNSIQGPSPTRTPIYWDEYFHGERTGLATYFGKTPLPWGAWQLALAAVLVIFSFSRRSGPIVMPAAVSRLSPLEFVDTMGALYRHASAFSIPVEVSYRNLRLELTQRLGLPAAISDADLATAAAERLRVDRAEMAAALTASAAAQRSKVSSRQALALVERLESLLEKI
jgi:hypothetical protein